MSKMGRGRPISGQAREIIFNVAEYFKRGETTQRSYIMSTSDATRVSESAVRRVMVEGRRSIATKGKLSFSTPQGKKLERKKRIEVDDFTICTLRGKIYEMYTVEKTPPTINKLLPIVREDLQLDCRREYLRTLLKKSGFCYKKTQSKRRVLLERQEVAAWRARYLRGVKMARHERKTIIYLDETYVHATHTVSMCWQFPEEIAVAEVINEGNRLIMGHVGGEGRFVLNALLIFKPKPKSGDYHDDMSFTNFSKLVEEKLLPNLPPACVIVMDIASYNVQDDKMPSASSAKADMQQWLSNHDIPFEDSFLRTELLQLVRENPSTVTYKVDKLFKEQGHTVYHLPPYHADLNPIKLVWGDIKGSVAQNNTGSNLQEIRGLCEKEFTGYTKEKWKKCCDHVKRVEERYLVDDSLMESVVEALLTSVNNSPDCSDDSGDESDIQMDEDSG